MGGWIRLKPVKRTKNSGYGHSSISSFVYSAADQNNTYLSLESVDDELQSVWVNTFDAFLDYVVAVLVFNAFQHVAV